MIKRTVLYEHHVAQGARMAEFGGYEMPIQFTRIQEEHMAVREKAGLFDVSHMGEFLVEGKGAVALLEKITTNQVADLRIGQAQYTLMTNPDGGIIDDLLLYRLADEKFMMVVNAGNIGKDWNWVIENKSYDTVTRNISTEMGVLALQGPFSKKILSKLTYNDVGDIPFYHFDYGEVAGINDVIISATGYTGSGGFELYTGIENVEALWSALMDAGAPEGMLQAGLGARDTLRLEMGYTLYGQEIDEDINPLQAGLGWIVKLDKNTFIGQDAMIKQKAKGLVDTLKGFILHTKRVPRTGHTIHDLNKKKIGRVTSGTFSPCLQKSIGLGYFHNSYLKNDMELLVFNGKKYFEGHLTKTPFVNVKDYVS